MNFKDVAIKSAKLAGRLVKEAFSNYCFFVDEKDGHDIITSVNRSSKHIIFQNILKCFSGHSIHSEETGTLGKDPQYTWFIAPIDGAVNFFTGNPYFTISIALASYEKVILGVVYVPVTDDLYCAEKGQGAYLNNKIIHVSERDELSNSFVASAYSDRKSEMARGLRLIRRLSTKSKSVVMNFTPSLDLCNIASGRLDALVDNGSAPEEHAAASLILTEAGGIVRNYYSTGWDFRERGIIASNGSINNELLKVIKK